MLKTLAQDYTMLVAHEYFDVMPINLFEVSSFFAEFTRSMTETENSCRLARGIRRS